MHYILEFFPLSIFQDISTSNKQVKCLKIELDQHKVDINEQLIRNKEIQYEIAQLNEESSKVRQQLNDSMESVQLNVNEVITLKRELRNKTNCLQQIRQNNRQINIDCDKLTKTVAKLKSAVDELTAKANIIDMERNNADSRLKHLTELFDSEERSVEAVQLEINRITQMLYRTTQILQQERDEYKLIEVCTRLALFILCSRIFGTNNPKLPPFRVRFIRWRRLLGR